MAVTAVVCGISSLSTGPSLEDLMAGATDTGPVCAGMSMQSSVYHSEEKTGFKL